MPKTERVSCPLCKKKSERHLFSKDGFRVVRCNHCGLTYINPRLTIEALTTLYNTNEISPEPYYEANIPQDVANFTTRIKLLEKFARKKGKLLDIGCNIGTFLHVAKKRGWKVSGVEFNKSAVRFGRKRFGVDIMERDFTKARFKPASFDAVTMNDVIEHVTDPVATLHEVHRILKPKGVLLMTTPNIAGTVARLSGSKWLHVKPNEHLHFFTPKTMQRILDETGYKLVHRSSFGRTRSLETILFKTQTYSTIPYKLSRIVPKTIREGIKLTINAGDEMVVIAVKQ